MATKFTNIFLHDVSDEDFELPPDASVFPPVFGRPMASSAVLPSGRFLFRAWSPAYFLAPAAKKNGEKMISTNANGNYLGLVLDPMGRIQEVRFLGIDPPLEHNLLSLIGMPGSYLHNLVARYEEGIVPDIYGFLKENWSFLVFHDRFGALRAELFEKFVTQIDVQSIEEEMRSLLQDRPVESAYISDGEWNSLFEKISQDTRRDVERACIEFMRKNKDIFHMYHIPECT